jgi:mono/diheme cytochrome c family protein
MPLATGVKMEIRLNGGSTLGSWITRLLVVILLCIVGGSHLARAQETKHGKKAAEASRQADLIVRGKYIVEGVAACGDCHTPRNEKGELDRSRWLEGAPVFLQPAQRVSGWPLVAPRLAGLPPGTDAEIVTLLTTGLWREGKPLRMPMPHFHMTREDAAAVLAYLKSLSPAGAH